MPSSSGPLLRRTLLALVAVATLGVSACGDDGDGPSADPDGVLTRDEISEALLPVGSTVEQAEVGPEDLPGFADDREADREECQPLSAIVDLDPEPTRSARVQVDVKPLGAWVHVQLLTYPAGDAEEVLDQVATAVEACADGYVETRVREYPVHEVAREEGPAIGDQVVAFSTTATDSMDTEPFPLDEHTVLVRDGQQVLAFRAGSIGEDEEALALLGAVVDAQWERYAAAR